MSSLTDIALAYAPAEHHAMIRQIPMPYAAKEDVKFLKTVPVLVVHSREDKEVPFAQGEVLYSNAAGRRNLLVYSGGHLEGMKANTQEYLTRIDALLK